MVEGVGIGFRRELARALLEATDDAPQFVEFAPENWMGIGGRWGRAVQAVIDRYPVLCHGLSLSLGSPEPLDWDFLKELKQFLQQAQVEIFSEHLSFSKCANAHMHDLLPLPFTQEAVHHAASRIREVQDYLGRRIAIENITYYARLESEMDEATFLRAVAEEADCDLLLDINNVYVNAHNHSYDAHRFVEALPLERVTYVHMAGHEEGELKIDSHGEPICEGVFELFEWTVQRLHPVPVLLERDSNIPPYAELVGEMKRMQRICDHAWAACAS